jgi:hypothetical protein
MQSYEMLRGENRVRYIWNMPSTTSSSRYTHTHSTFLTLAEVLCVCDGWSYSSCFVSMKERLGALQSLWPSTLTGD